jgi:hypothetical protein
MRAGSGQRFDVGGGRETGAGGAGYRRALPGGARGLVGGQRDAAGVMRAAAGRVREDGGGGELLEVTGEERRFHNLGAEGVQTGADGV